jgi:uncharacterized membrane protein YedE/YeeE
MAEDEHKLDRELNELLQELRVAIPGVQILFAFLLTVPFSQRFVDVTDIQKGAFTVAFLCATVATVLLMAPSAYHRLRWRERDKERMLRTSNVFALVGLAFLAVALVAAVYFITDFLFRGVFAIAVAAAAGLLFLGRWYALPLKRRLAD